MRIAAERLDHLLWEIRKEKEWAVFLAAQEDSSKSRVYQDVANILQAVRDRRPVIVVENEEVLQKPIK